MRSLRTFWPIVLAVLVGFLAGVALPPARATQYRLSTAENDLVTIINQHATFLNEAKADFNLLRTDFLLLKGNVENRSEGGPVLVEGTNANTIKTTAACFYTIGGVSYKKAATDNIAMTAATAQADLTYRLYLVSINANGDVAITAGTAEATDIATLPALPAASAPLGYFKIATSGGTFTSGSTDLSGAGVTDTFYDTNFVVSGPNANTATSTAIATAAAHTARN